MILLNLMRLVISTAAVIIILSIIVLLYDPATVYADSPEETFSKYINAMREHNPSPELDIYTKQTREMLSGWNVTTTQMDNIVKAYKGCYGAETKFNDSYTLAVIRYNLAQKQCSPWFFKNISGNWLLDLTMMQRAIRFGPGNAWHFVAGLQHEYEFGFADWKFNNNGYPVTDMD